MNQPDELNPRVRKALHSLRQVAPRSAAQAARGRAEFLRQAEQTAAGAKISPDSSPQTVSLNGKARHIQWIDPLIAFYARKKEQRPMFATIATVLVITTLIFGGSAGVVAASQDSLPDQALYPVKTWSEQVRTSFTNDPEAQLRLNLELSARRAAEIDDLLAQGKTPPDAVQSQLRLRLEESFDLVGAQPEADTLRALEQVRAQLRLMDETFQPTGDPAGDPIREQLRSTVRTCLQVIDAGQQDPQLLREKLQERLNQNRPEAAPELGGEPEPKEPQNGPQNGPRNEITPTPGAGPGPGPATGPGEGPAPDDGPGPANDAGPGPQPNPDNGGQPVDQGGSPDNGGQPVDQGGSPDNGGQPVDQGGSPDNGGDSGGDGGSGDGGGEGGSGDGNGDGSGGGGNGGGGH